MSRTSVLSLTAAVFPASNTTTTTAKGILSSGEVKRGDWAAAYAIATALVAELTNQGKITIITGGSVDSAWTALAFKDGTHGVQAYDDVTGFGEGSALAMTWDKTFMYDPFKAIALKFYGKGFRVLNGPTSQPLERTPWGGRLVEAFTLDSYLNGKPFPRAFADAGVMPGGRKAFLAERAGDQPSSIGLLWCCAILQCR